MLLPMIVASDTGSRLWLISRELYPKQFLRLSGQNSMLQEIITRLSDLEIHEPMVICNEEHHFLVAGQPRQLNKLSNNITLEPARRNTVPTIASVTLQVTRHGDDSLIPVLTTDHIINNQPIFHDAIRVAGQHADEGRLVTFGVMLSASETGYGYIQRGVVPTDSAHAPHQVVRFVGKSNRRRAEIYLASGEYYWNSDMFMLRTKKYLSELVKFRPDILKTCQAAVNAADNGSDFISISHDVFCECPDEFVDYTVMGKTVNVVMVSLGTDWSDVGSRSAPREVSPKDKQGNVLNGDAWVYNSEDCYINSDKRLVAAIGVEDLVIVNTKDAVLAMNRKRSRDMRKVIEFLKQNQCNGCKHHREIYRPQGRYDVVAQTPRFSVNCITAKPGDVSSMQMYHYCTEHQVVLAGTGQVTVNDKQFLLTENQSTFIPTGAKHSLEDPGRILLKVLGIRSGPYLGEDDIVRIKDQYGRC